MPFTLIWLLNLSYSPNRKEASILPQFYYMPERYERVRVGWHCAKVRVYAELKIKKTRVKTFIVTISPNYTIPSPTVSLLRSTYANIFLKMVMVIDRSRDVITRCKYKKKSKGHPRSPCVPNRCKLYFTSLYQNFT